MAVKGGIMTLDQIIAQLPDDWPERKHEIEICVRASNREWVVITKAVFRRPFQNDTATLYLGIDE